MSLAMISAAVVAAQFAAGKATRDAMFFSSMTITALPAVVTATALFSIVLVLLHGRAVRRVRPATLVPVLFVVSGLLFIAEYFLRARGPAAAAVALYLHVSGAGPLLGSGFWLIATERFNPRTAKKGFGRITAAGTVGALAGAVIAERLAAVRGGPVMVLVLAGFQFAAAYLVRRVALSGEPVSPSAALDLWPGAADDRAGVLDSAGPMRGGLRLIAETPALRSLAALVLLGSTSAAIVDYVFKARAVEAYGPGDGLLRFFAIYYAATSIASLLLQALSSRAVLERFGLALTTSTPSLALLAGSVAGLLDPGFASLLVARGGEAVFRGSWFRAGYELFYTPMPAAERRSAKSIIDVAFDRLGDAVGAALVRIVIVVAPVAQASAMLAVSAATSLLAIAVASRLHRWYLRTLESSLVSRGSDLAPGGDMEDPATRRVLNLLRRRGLTPTAVVATNTSPGRPDDEVMADIRRLRSGNHEVAMRVLTRSEGLAAPLIPHVIPLLASTTLADYALFALRKVAEERIGQLTDALLDPSQDDAVRRRLARVFSIGVSQRAVDGLLAALDDPRFDVRFQTARSLAAIADRNPLVRIDPTRVFAVVLEEVTVGQPVWESQRLLDGCVSASPLDAFVRDRAGQSLAHVFTLLSLVLPRQPLLIAFRSLHTEDAYLRGTALEYLEGVLPADIRHRLWPFLVRPRTRHAIAPRTQAIANLLKSSRSVTVRGFAERRDQDPLAGLTTH